VWLFRLSSGQARLWRSTTRENPFIRLICLPREALAGSLLFVGLYYAGAAVDGDDLSVAKAGGGLCGGDHGGDAVLAGN
jgi:hypothetical protein